MNERNESAPEGLDRGRNLDLAGRGHGPWWRRAGLALIGAFAVAALLNTFGQADVTTNGAGPAATLKIRAPKRVRGGLLYQARFELTALQPITLPKIVLERGWNDGLTINTLEPQPVGEAARGDRLVFTFNKMQAGDKTTLWIDYQVNPTHLGTTNQDVEVDDRNVVLLRIHRTLTTFP
jgi:hypothetical protein